MLSLLYELEGYRARVERDREGVLHGRVIEIEATVTFKAQTLRLVERNFARALEAYFERCRLLGKEPEDTKPLGF